MPFQLRSLSSRHFASTTISQVEATSAEDPTRFIPSEGPVSFQTDPRLVSRAPRRARRGANGKTLSRREVLTQQKEELSNH